MTEYWTRDHEHSCANSVLISCIPALPDTSLISQRYPISQSIAREWLVMQISAYISQVARYQQRNFHENVQLRDRFLLAVWNRTVVYNFRVHFQMFYRVASANMKSTWKWTTPVPGCAHFHVQFTAVV